MVDFDLLKKTNNLRYIRDELSQVLPNFVVMYFSRECKFNSKHIRTFVNSINLALGDLNYLEKIKSVKKAITEAFENSEGKDTLKEVLIAVCNVLNINAKNFLG